MSLIHVNSPKIKATTSYIKARGIFVGDLTDHKFKTNKNNLNPLKKLSKWLLKGFLNLWFLP